MTIWYLWLNGRNIIFHTEPRVSTWTLEVEQTNAGYVARLFLASTHTLMHTENDLSENEVLTKIGRWMKYNILCGLDYTSSLT